MNLIYKIIIFQIVFFVGWYTFYIPLLRFVRRKIHQIFEPVRSKEFLVCAKEYPFHQQIVFHLYIIVHDEKTEETVKRWSKCCGWVTVLRIPSTKYFESIVYFTGLPQHRKQWKDFDYVGVCTYRVLEAITIEKLKILLELTHYADYDVVPLINGGERLLSQGIRGHTDEFKKMWTIFLTSLQFTSRDIEKSENVEVFYRNSFIIKPEALQDLSRIMRRGILTIERNQTLSNLIATDSHYREAIFRKGVSFKVFEKPFYSWHPFLLERLPSYFFAITNRTVFSSLVEIELFTNPTL